MNLDTQTAFVSRANTVLADSTLVQAWLMQNPAVRHPIFRFLSVHTEKILLSNVLIVVGTEERQVLAFRLFRRSPAVPAALARLCVIIGIPTCLLKSCLVPNRRLKVQLHLSVHLGRTLVYLLRLVCDLVLFPDRTIAFPDVDLVLVPDSVRNTDPTGGEYSPSSLVIKTKT